MQILLLLALALAPCIAIILFIYYRDTFEKEPKGLLIACFFLGVLSILPAIILEDILWGIPLIGESAFLKATLGTGLVEEACKLFFVLILPYWRKAFNEPLDGIIYCMMVSMGFAATENIMYVMQGGLGVAIMRIFTAVPAHGMFAVLMGYFVGIAKFSKAPDMVFILMGLLAASAFHGAYDYFLFEQNIPGIWVGALVSLVVGVILSLRAIKVHRKKSAATIR